MSTDKRELRAKMKALRAAANDRAGRDGRIFQNLFSLPRFCRAESFFVYHSVGTEAETLRIIRELSARGKRVYLPRVEGRGMVAVRYCGQALAEGRFKTPEPTGEAVSEGETIEVCVLPLLAADERFRRLGYGGGFYDRYLSSRADMLKIGICYDFQLLAEVPAEAHDVALDAIVTDCRILVRTGEDLP